MAERVKNIIVKKGLDEWVMTYGDMMSLLLTFFILIVSFSSMQESKFHQASESLRGAFGVLGDPATIIDFQQPLIPPETYGTEEGELQEEVSELEKAVLEADASQEVQVEVQPDGVVFRLDAPFLFASGGADLTPAALPVLDKMAEVLAKHPERVRVEGHTDAIPIHSAKFASNWELSAARAVTVARYFQSRGVAPERMSATGYGEFKPLAGNDSAEGRATNRRVEIFLAVERRSPGQAAGLPITAAPAEGRLDAAPPTVELPEKPTVRPIINPVTGRLGIVPGIDR